METPMERADRLIDEYFDNVSDEQFRKDIERVFPFEPPEPQPTRIEQWLKRIKKVISCQNM